MKCKSCKREIPDESIFCLHCGEKVVRSRGKKAEISVPKPVRQKSGEWYSQLMVKGVRYPVKGSTEAEYYAKARALKLGLLHPEKKLDKMLLREALRSYIDNNKNVLSPSTIRGYEIIYRNRFGKYMDKPLSLIDFQALVNDEAARYAPKTVANAWGLISPALAAVKFPVPDINLPSVPASDEDFLDYEQIKVFCQYARSSKYELPALLALHGLRLSELMDVDAEDIQYNAEQNAYYINVKGATLYNWENELVHKDTNKNRTSTRSVPVVIPRLLEILPAVGRLVTCRPNTVYRNMIAICRKASLPECSPHDLRRSFASLAYHLRWNAQTTMVVGGWSDITTVEKVYRKLAEKEKNQDIEKMLSFYSNA